jgi:hypothetical protein
VSDLLISTVDVGMAARRTPYSITLTDGNGNEIQGFVGDDIVTRSVFGTTASDGTATVDLIPSASITPANTYYTLRLAGESMLIEKGPDAETILEALAADPQPLAPALLAAHIADPTGAHDGTAITFTDTSDYGITSDNASDAIIELAEATLSGLGAATGALLGHIAEPAAAHNASQITYTLDPYVSVADAIANVEQLARTEYTPGSNTTTTTTSETLTAIDASNLSVTFTAPASDSVRVDLEALAMRAGAGVLTVWGVINDSASVVVDNLGTSLTADLIACTRSAVIRGLVPGQSYTWRFAHRAESAGTATTYYAPAATASITVTAVP